MRKISEEELKIIQLEILKQVDLFCRNHKIDYSLAYGTLLGAVRHKGYIPWDDDIDIMMTRSNYNTFLKCFNGAFKHLYVISPELNWNFYAPYANVCDNRTILYEGDNDHRVEIGVKIDVFPIDAVPTDFKLYDKMKKRINLLESYLWARKVSFWRRTIKEKILWICMRLSSIFWSYSDIQKRIYEIAIKEDADIMQYCDNVVWDITRARCRKELYNQLVEIEFENEKFLSVRDYDTYLKNRYGNYLELPPKDKRVSHHDFTAFWK